MRKSVLYKRIFNIIYLIINLILIIFCASIIYNIESIKEPFETLSYYIIIGLSVQIIMIGIQVILNQYFKYKNN